MLGNDTDADNDRLTAVLDVDVSFGTLSLNANGSFSYTPNAGFTGDDAFSYFANDGQALSDTSALVTITVNGGGGNQPPVLDPIGNKSVSTGANLTFTVTASDDGQPNGTLTLSASNLPSGATFTDNGNGSGYFEWLNASPAGSTNTTFTASDSALTDSEQITITVNDIPPPPQFQAQTDFKIMMNYELGMHCTGFEFAYCCVLPAYNSILAQVIKPQNQGPAQHGGDFPMLMEGDPNEGLDALGRETVGARQERAGRQRQLQEIRAEILARCAAPQRRPRQGADEHADQRGGRQLDDVVEHEV